jgi:cytidylate kinase
MSPGRVLLNGEDVTTAIRTPEATATSSAVAVNALVRRRLADLQRSLAAGHDYVCEGRDQGTVVFPDATCKFFLVADPIERARRRQREMEARGETVDLSAVLAALEARDRRDAARDLAPMRPADDAVILDTTSLTLEEVVERMEAEARRRMKHVEG